MIVGGRYLCSLCARPKGEANHWFLGKLMTIFGLAIQTWNDDEARTRTLHYCSEACAHIAMSRYCHQQAIAERIVRSHESDRGN